MVGPAVEREAVAHLRTMFQIASGGPAPSSPPIGPASGIDSAGRLIPSSGAGCAIWPMHAGGSAIGGCSSCCASRVSHPASTGFTGSIARKG